MGRRPAVRDWRPGGAGVPAGVRHLAAEEADLLVGEGRDRAAQHRERRGEGLVGVHDRVHVGAGAVDVGVHAALDRGRQGGAGPVGIRDVVAVEVDDADVLDAHPVVGVVARGHGVEPATGHPHRDVALGGLEVAALEHRATHVDDVLAGGEVLHGWLLS